MLSIFTKRKEEQEKVDRLVMFGFSHLNLKKQSIYEYKRKM